MPEIPEIETVRRQLAQNIFGKKIIKIKGEREKTFNLPLDEVVDLLQDTVTTQVIRKGKVIVLQFNKPLSLYFHFMLDGFVKFLKPGEEWDKKYQLMLEFSTGERLYFCKMYLGYIHLEETTDLDQIEEIAELGPDLIVDQLSLEEFKEMLQSRRKMIKPLLMEQDFIAGIGNTYSNEGLFRAGIIPDKKASNLSNEEIERLYQELLQLLNEAIEEGGVGDTFFSSDDRLTGGFRDNLRVSYKEDEPCPICGQPISYQKIGGRNAFYCENCQS